MQRRYGSINFLDSFSITEAVEILLYAQEQEEEEKLFNRWLSYQSEMSFDDFKRNLHSVAHPKSEKQIMDDVEDIMTAFDNERGIKDVI